MNGNQLTQKLDWQTGWGGEVGGRGNGLFSMSTAADIEQTPPAERQLQLYVQLLPLQLPQQLLWRLLPA